MSIDRRHVERESERDFNERELPDREDPNEGRHPALRNFNRTGFMVRHAILKGLKWAVIGTVGMAVAGLVGTALFTGSNFGMGMALVESVKHWVSPGAGVERSLLGGVMNMFTTGGFYGALAGGIGGALLGFATGIAEGSDMADQEEERLIARCENRDLRQERLVALRLERDQTQAAARRQNVQLGVNPNFGLGGPRAGQAQPDLS